MKYNQSNEGRTKSRQLQVHQMCMKVGKRKIRKPEQGTGVHSCTYFLPKLFSNSTNKTYLHRCTERGRGGNLCHHSDCFIHRPRKVASTDLHTSFGELLEIQHCPPCQRCQLEELTTKRTQALHFCLFSVINVILSNTKTNFLRASCEVSSNFHCASLFI